MHLVELSSRVKSRVKTLSSVLDVVSLITGSHRIKPKLVGQTLPHTCRMSLCTLHNSGRGLWGKRSSGCWEVSEEGGVGGQTWDTGEAAPAFKWLLTGGEVHCVPEAQPMFSTRGS